MKTIRVSDTVHKRLSQQKCLYERENSIGLRFTYNSVINELFRESDSFAYDRKQQELKNHQSTQ